MRAFLCLRGGIPMRRTFPLSFSRSFSSSLSSISTPFSPPSHSLLLPRSLLSLPHNHPFFHPSLGSTFRTNTLLSSSFCSSTSSSDEGERGEEEGEKKEEEVPFEERMNELDIQIQRIEEAVRSGETITHDEWATVIENCLTNQLGGENTKIFNHYHKKGLHFARLFKTRELGMDEITTNRIIRALLSPRIEETTTRGVEWLDGMIKTKRSRVDTRTLLLAVHNLARFNNVNKVKAYTDVLLSLDNFFFKLEDLNAILSGYARNGSLSLADDLFHVAVEERNVKPDVQTFSILINACAKEKKLDKAMEYLGEMSSHSLRPNIFTVNSLLDVCAKSNQLQRGIALFERTLNDGRFALDLTTWNTIINGCAEAKHVKTAEKYMKKMTKYGFEPDVYTYTSLLKACALSGWLHDAMRLKEEMISKGLEPNSHTLNTLINACARARKLEPAKAFFEQAKKSNPDDIIAWNSIINACARTRMKRVAIQYFDEMKELGVKPDHRTWSALIDACSGVGDFYHAYNYLEEMKKQKMHTNKHVYSMVIRAAGKHGKVKEARELYGNLIQKDEPDCVVMMGLVQAIANHRLDDHKSLTIEFIMGEMARYSLSADELFVKSLKTLLKKGGRDESLAKEVLKHYGVKEDKKRKKRKAKQ